MKLREYNGFVVLCELQWNHKATSADFSEFQGIYFVQDYLRRELGLKAPVVFTSFMDAKEIVKQQPVYSIIMTPALQHEFVRLPSPPEALVEPFAQMWFMSDTELVYTQMQYCNFKGLLGQIKHNAEGRNDTELIPFRKQIEYVLDRQFKDDLRLKEEFDKTPDKDISSFCEKLINKLNEYSDNSSATAAKTVIDIEFACKYKSDQIKVLMLEDDMDDKNVRKFNDYIKSKNKAYQKEGVWFLFSEPHVVKGKKEFTNELNLNEYQVVICDIEIREEGYLTSLGFNLVREAAKSNAKPLYYIVTNVTRSFFDQIKRASVRRIYLKKEVFGSNDNIRTFLYGIKEVVEEKQVEEINTYKKCELTFHKLYNYVKYDDGYFFNYSNYSDGTVCAYISAFDELEAVVKEQSLVLIKQFLKYCRTKNVLETDDADLMKKNNYRLFNENCSWMRAYISVNVELGNEKSLFYLAGNEKIPTKEDLERFAIRLTLRRFFLYVRGFVDHYKIMESVNFNKLEAGDSRKFNQNDIACRAINTDCKCLRIMDSRKVIIDEAEYFCKTQTHCLDKILLILPTRVPEIISKEEREFVVCLRNMENPYDWDEKSVERLQFTY